MIPFYQSGPLFTLPLINREVHLFGVLVVIGILLGSKIAFWKAKKMEIDLDKLSSMITFMLVCGFVSAHLFESIFYNFPEVVKNPLILLNFWSGISSYGGFLGAFLGILYYTKRNKLDLLTYAEPIAFGLPFGWFFGRLGCASVHDHIGAKTDFFLAINFPDLGIRHDLGLYEAIFTFFLCLLFIFLRNNKYSAGTYLMLLCLLYAPVRFFLDSLRATDLASSDVRFLSLTPGQYSSIALLIGGIYLFRKLYSGKASNNQ